MEESIGLKMVKSRNEIKYCFVNVMDGIMLELKVEQSHDPVYH